MKIYKELDDLGFFKWYCTQYGSLVYQEYKPVYDDLPLDNIIRTELNACVFKFFREKHKLDSVIIRSFSMTNSYHYNIVIDQDYGNDLQSLSIPDRTYEQAELECIKKLIKIVTK